MFISLPPLHSRMTKVTTAARHTMHLVDRNLCVCVRQMVERSGIDILERVILPHILHLAVANGPTASLATLGTVKAKGVNPYSKS